MNKTIPLCLLFIIILVSCVQLVFAENILSIGFDPNPIPSSSYEPPSQPNNLPPVANITGPIIGYVNQSLIFSGQYSYDPDGIIIGYRWDYENDGLFDTEWTKNNITTHIFYFPGNFTIKLQVEDNNLSMGVTLFHINIIPLPPPLQLPIAQANGPYQAYVNQTIIFFSNGSYDPDGVIVNYTWDFGDGTLAYHQNSEYKYTQPGNYTVTLTIRDNDNLCNIALVPVYIHEKSGTSGTSYSAPEMNLPIILIPCMVLIFIIVIIFTRLTTLTQDLRVPLKRQYSSFAKNGRNKKYSINHGETKQKPIHSKINVLMGKPKQKRRIGGPIGRSVFLSTGDEKLGDIIETISDESNQIIGYKIKDNQSEKILHLFAEHCSQQNNNYICTPDCFTIPSDVIEGLATFESVKSDLILLTKGNTVLKDDLNTLDILQNEELRKNIDHLYALDKMIKGSLYVLKKEQIYIEDSLKELKIKRGEHKINEEQYQLMVLPYQQVLERIDQNIKKYRKFNRRFTRTSIGKLNIHYK
jgi:PKD repeat protein